jgi:outer membrane protein
MSVFRVSRLVLACATLSIPLWAQVKVGVISSQRALIETAEIKKAQAELEAKFKPRQDALDKLQREIQGLQQQLQTMQGKLTPQAEQDMVAQGQRKQRDAQRLAQDLQEDVNREREDILQRAGTRMQDVVSKLAEAKGLDLVVDESNTVFRKPALDITKDATAAYDKAYPVK